MQQPLERYGVVVLLFLVALVAVAVFWEDGSSTRKVEETLAEVTPVRETPPAPPVRERPPVGPNEGRDQRRPGVLKDDETKGVDRRGSTDTYDVRPIHQGQGLNYVEPEIEGSKHLGGTGFSQQQGRGGQPPIDDRMANLSDRPLDPRNGSDPLIDNLGGGASERKGGTGPGSDDRVAPVKGQPAPAPTPTPAPAPAPPATREVVVGDGDSLWRIAARELGDGKRWKEIATLNGIEDGDDVKAGARLRLPAASKTQTPASNTPAPSAKPQAKPEPKSEPKAAPAPSSTGEQRIYIVRAGDTLGRIAQRELGSAKRVDELRLLNSISGDVIRVGESLRLPGGAAPRREDVAVATPPKAPERRAAPRRPAADSEFVVR